MAEIDTSDEVFEDAETSFMSACSGVDGDDAGDVSISGVNIGNGLIEAPAPNTTMNVDNFDDNEDDNGDDRSVSPTVLPIKSCSDTMIDTKITKIKSNDDPKINPNPIEDVKSVKTTTTITTTTSLNAISPDTDTPDSTPVADTEHQCDTNLNNNNNNNNSATTTTPNDNNNNTKSDPTPSSSPPPPPPPAPEPDRVPVSMVNSPPIRAGVKSSFAGKNGGDANDAELLALLKGISSGSNGTASNTPSPVAASPPPPPPTADDVVDDDSKALPPPPPEPKPAPLPAAQAPTTTVPTPDDGSSTFDPTSSNWKVRKSSYEVINSHLSAHPDAPPFATSSLKIEGCATPLDLDSCLPSYLQDSNAATLDSAVSLALSYARVSSAVHSSSAGCVPGLCSSLVSHAFASSRPSTAKTSRLLAAALCTNCPTPSNLCTLSTTLLSLPTKNPKVHASCVDTLLHLSSLYGAHLLPLSAVSSRAPAILGHPDGRVRSSCVELLAAVETACGPSVLAAVVSGMKDQQERQFRATVESRPRPGRAKEDVPWGGTNARSRTRSGTWRWRGRRSRRRRAGRGSRWNSWSC